MTRRVFLEEGGDDLSKCIIFGVTRAYWLPFENRVAAWVHEGWETWEEEKPDWFTDLWRASVPKYMIPRRQQSEGLGSPELQAAQKGRRKSFAEALFSGDATLNPTKAAPEVHSSGSGGGGGSRRGSRAGINKERSVSGQHLRRGSKFGGTMTNNKVAPASKASARPAFDKDEFLKKMGDVKNHEAVPVWGDSLRATNHPSGQHERACPCSMGLGLVVFGVTFGFFIVFYFTLTAS